MAVRTSRIQVSTKGGVDILPLSKKVIEAVHSSGLRDGIVCIHCAGATGVITTLEFEDGVLRDVDEALERLFPVGLDYKHHLKWNDGNGHSHVRAAVLGPSLCVPFTDSEPVLGRWQEIVFIELDNKPRSRELIVQMVGD